MSPERLEFGQAASVEPEGARIGRRAIVMFKEPGETGKMRVIGHTEGRGRPTVETGQADTGSSLREIDLERRVVVNRRGPIIALLGGPVSPGDLPDDPKAMSRRAERARGLDAAAERERLEPIRAPGSGKSRPASIEREGLP